MALTAILLCRFYIRTSLYSFHIPETYPSHLPDCSYLICGAIFFASLADQPSPDKAADAFTALEEAIFRYQAMPRSWRHYIPESMGDGRFATSVMLALAIKAGMINLTRLLASAEDTALANSRQSTPIWPPLLHALEHGLLRHFKDLTGSKFSHSLEMIRYLLSEGCKPNETYREEQYYEDTTPWSRWMENLRRMSRDEFYKTLDITEELIRNGADLHVLVYYDLSIADIIAHHLTASHIMPTPNFPNVRSMKEKGRRVLLLARGSRR